MRYKLISFSITYKKYVLSECESRIFAIILLLLQRLLVM